MSTISCDCMVRNYGGHAFSIYGPLFWNNLALDVRVALSGEVKRRDRFIKFRVTVLVYPDITRASRLLCYVLKIHLLLLLLLLIIASLLRYNGTSSSDVTPG